MSRKAKALGGESQGKKSARLDGFTRHLPFKPISQFCQGLIHGLILPLKLVHHQFLHRIIDLAIRYDIRWKWVHRLADRQEARDE